MEDFKIYTEKDIFKVSNQDEIDDKLDKVRAERTNISKKPWYISKLDFIDKQAVMHEVDIDDDNEDCSGDDNKINKWYGYEANIIILQQMKPIDITSLKDIYKTEEEIVDYVQDNIGRKISFDIVFNKNHITLKPFYKYYAKICEKYKRSKYYKSLMKDITYHYNTCIRDRDKITNKQLKLNNGKFYIYEE